MSKEKIATTAILILLTIPIVSGSDDLLETVTPGGKIIGVMTLICIFVLIVVEAIKYFKK